MSGREESKVAQKNKNIDFSFFSLRDFLNFRPRYNNGKAIGQDVVLE